MIDRIDLFHLPFYKREAFTGSDRGLRFRIEKGEDGEQFCVTIWPEPFAYKHTAEEKKKRQYFPFEEESLDRIYEWLTGPAREQMGLLKGCKKEG